MGFIIRMRILKLLLVMRQLPLLLRTQHRKLFFFRILDFFWLYCRQIVLVVQFRESFFFAETPTEVVVVRDEDHVVGVDCSEGGESVAHYGEEGDEDVVDYVYDVVFSGADTDPADQEEYPDEAEESD
jgi:hypothetical protein